MATKYSKSKQGDNKLSANFTVREFACSDGSDTVLIDAALVKLLQQIRNWAGTSVKITSGYRTPAYNKKIGGAANSYHTKGQAADIVVSGKTPAQVARFAQAIGADGVGLYTASKFVHIDTRASHYFWKNDGKGNVTVSGHGGKCAYTEPKATLRRGQSGNGVRWLQWWLSLWGYNIKIDGGFGEKTETAVKNLQERRGLVTDGIAGEKTRNTLKGF